MPLWIRKHSRLVIFLCIGCAFAACCWFRAETRVHSVEPGRVFRGAWQRPDALRNLIRRRKIRTVVTLTAINRDDPKYVSQSKALRGLNVDWVIIPMRGSTATLQQLREAVTIIANPARQPVFFHCVGGHHRSNLVHAAYLITEKHMSADEAWSALVKLPWTRPEAFRDQADRRLIQDYEHLLTSLIFVLRSGVHRQ